MEVLFFIILIGFFCFFIGYWIKLFREDKKILDEYKEKKRQSEIPDQENGRVLGWRDLSEEEMGIQFSEHPFIDSYQSLN